jgi:putative two-component system response regulator
VDAVIPGVQYHHERWDGTGYPERLKGDAIPFLARLLGVADFYDALTSVRAYRPAMAAAEAIRLVAEGAGTHFDPAVAAAAVRLFERGAFNVDLLPSEVRQMLPNRADGR